MGVFVDNSSIANWIKIMKELSGSTLKMALVHNEINYVRQLKLSKQGIDHYYSYQFSKNLKNSENGLKYDLVVFCSSAYI